MERDLLLRRLKKAKRQGRFVEPESQDHKWLMRLSFARLLLGDRTWKNWESRSVWGQMCWLNEKEFGIPRWRGEDCKLLVLGEQGLGDEILFSQFIPKNSGFICEERLNSVFERCLGVKCHPRDPKEELKNVKRLIKEHGYERYIAVADIPRVTGISAPRGMYIWPDREKIAGVACYKGLTGTSWRGRNGQYDHRDFPQGLSLQYDLYWDEDAEQPDIDLRNDIEGVFALVSMLKKVITVSTTVLHIAGSMGVPTDVILAPWESGESNNQLNWRHGLGGPHPFYKSCTVYNNLNEWRAINKSR